MGSQLMSLKCRTEVAEGDKYCVLYPNSAERGSVSKTWQVEVLHFQLQSIGAT
ncbi:hypothetical protein [Nostoc sp.]